MKKYRTIKPDKITEKDLRAINFNDVVYIETGGRMGMEGTMIYELKDGELILYRTIYWSGRPSNPTKEETQRIEKDEKLDRIARKLISEYLSGTDNFTEYYGGFGNRPQIRNDIKLIPVTEKQPKDVNGKSMEWGYWTFDFDGETYRLDPSVNGVFQGVNYNGWQGREKESTR